jgi:hypothetical protein
MSEKSATRGLTTAGLSRDIGNRQETLSSRAGVSVEYRKVVSVGCRYTIGPDSARSPGGSKCVHLQLAISNVLTTFLSTEMKESVCGSGLAAATSLARASSCSSRRAIVRVSGDSLP